MRPRRVYSPVAEIDQSVREYRAAWKRLTTTPVSPVCKGRPIERTPAGGTVGFGRGERQPSQRGV